MGYRFLERENIITFKLMNSRIFDLAGVFMMLRII